MEFMTGVDLTTQLEFLGVEVGQERNHMKKARLQKIVNDAVFESDEDDEDNGSISVFTSIDDKYPSTNNISDVDIKKTPMMSKKEDVSVVTDSSPDFFLVVLLLTDLTS